MRKHENRLLSRVMVLLIAAAMMITMMPLAAFADDTAAPALTVTGEGLANPLTFKDIKELKNDPGIKASTITGVKFNVVNKSGTAEEFTVDGIRIVDLIGLAGLKEGLEIDTVTATASDGYSVTYTADEILKADLQGNYAMYGWKQVDAAGTEEKVERTFIGQFAEGENNKSKCVEKIVSLTVTTKAASVAPGKVKISKAAGAKKAVKLSWKAAKGADGYVVYKATKKNGKYSKAGTTAKTSFTVKKLGKGKTYYFKVRAYAGGSDKVYGSYSAPKKAKTK